MSERVAWGCLALILVLAGGGCARTGLRSEADEPGGDTGAGQDDVGPADAGPDSGAGPGEDAGPGDDAGLIVEQLGRFEILHDFPSTHLGNRRTVRIFLPESYGSEPGRRYPVLYMHDGQNLFQEADSSFGMEWQIDETVDQLTQAGQIPELIVVGADCTDARIEEYTPTADPERGGGKAALYARFLIEELKPYVDAHYSTAPGPGQTGVMGSSLGGVISFYLGWHHPEVFGKAGCVSSAFWWDDDEALRSLVAHEGEVPPTRFWVDSGTEEGEGYLETLHAMWDQLLARGYRFGEGLGCQEDFGALHNETAWARRVQNPLLFLFGSQPAAQLEAIELVPHGNRVGLSGMTTLAVQLDARFASGLVMTVPPGLVEFSSDDETIATVAPDGTVTARAVGRVVLHASYRNLTAAAEIEVVEQLLPVEVTFVLDASGSQLPLDSFVQLADPPPPAGEGSAFLVGNHPELGDWTPNRVALYDDGQTAGDEQAGDNLWTLSLRLPLGTPLLYKYTLGHEGQSWSGTEEFPLTNRAFTVQDEDGDGKMAIRDVFADRPEPTNTLPSLSVIVNP